MLRHNSTMKNRNRLLLHLAVLGLLTAVHPALAVEATISEPQTETWYQIEVLVYEPIEHTVANESWPVTLDEKESESLIQLTPIAESTRPNSSSAITTPDTTLINAFQKLPPETLTIAETANKLTQARNYRIITLQGWQQPVKQRHEAEAVHLTDKPLPLDNAASNPVVITPQGEQILNSPTEELIPPAEPQLDENGFLIKEIPARINGSVTVSLSRYLHMALNIRYYNPDVYLAEQIALQKPDEVIIDTFELKQSRRMRSKEVHVFDHPYFGVIATIIPVERVIPDVTKIPSNTTRGQ